MAFWHQPKRIYQIETKRSKHDLLNFLALKIEVAKANTGVSSIFKYPDYKQISIIRDTIKITDVTFNKFSLNIAGSIEIRLDDAEAGTILTAHFLYDDEIYPTIMAIMILCIIAGTIYLKFVALFSYAMAILIGFALTAGVIGLFKMSVSFADVTLKNYLITVLKDWGITGTLNTITDVEIK
jgi:hypothetical protein